MNQNKLDIIKHFIRYCKEELNIQSLPVIKLINDRSFVEQFRSYGEYSVHENQIRLYYPGRNLADVCRSLAHELVHHRQNELGMIATNSGETGSEIENEANALAGILMRDYGKLNLSVYDLDSMLQESKQPSLQEKIVKVPKEVLDKVDKLYNYLKANLDKLSQKTTNNSVSNPHVLPKFQKYFQLKDLRANKKSDEAEKEQYNVEIGVGVFNDKSDSGHAYMDPNAKLLIVNLAYFGDKEAFEEFVEHELVHAMDPKARDAKIASRLAHKDAEPDVDYDKYIKSPAEFDAFTAPLINKVSTNLHKMGDRKKEYRQLLINLLSDLRTKDYEELAASDKYVPLAWLFTKKEWSEDNWGAAWNEYNMELNKISRWVTKPTLYKRFLKRLGTEI